MKKHLLIGLATLLFVACGGDASVEPGGGGTNASSSGTGGTASGGTGGTSTSGTGGASTSGTGGASTSGSGGSGGGTATVCNPPCTMGLECCNGLCVNKMNDINNCGTCGNECTGGGPPFCDNGSCDAPPACSSGITCLGTQYCCGMDCCELDELCCVVNQGPTLPPTCMAPNDQGTCEPGCPECVCASPDTPIETPLGRRAIASLQVGDLVYSVDGAALVAVPIVQVSRTPVPPQHQVVQVRLASGEVLEISHGHPTADGRSFADLRAGDALGSATVAEVQTVPYRHGFTYDILPGSDSGTYLAGGALIGSTLKPQPTGPAGACGEPAP